MLSRYYICTCLVLLRVWTNMDTGVLLFFMLFRFPCQKARSWNKHSNGWYTWGNRTTGNVVFKYQRMWLENINNSSAGLLLWLLLLLLLLGYCYYYFEQVHGVIDTVLLENLTLLVTVFLVDQISCSKNQLGYLEMKRPAGPRLAPSLHQLKTSRKLARNQLLCPKTKLLAYVWFFSSVIEDISVMVIVNGCITRK